MIRLTRNDMLNVFYGTDTVAVRTKAFAAVASYEKKGYTVAHIDTDTYTDGVLADSVGAVSLFGERSVYVIDTPSAQKDFYDAVVAHLPACAESDNVFIVIENALLAAQKKKFAKYAEVIEEIQKANQERFNAFGMADSLARKDKKVLWLQLQDARAAGLSAEEIIGTLWWQLKSLRLAEKTNSAHEAGMKDYPYTKAKRSLQHFKDGELATLSRSLLATYHDGHGGKVDIDMALEAWVLTL